MDNFQRISSSDDPGHDVPSVSLPDAAAQTTPSDPILMILSQDAKFIEAVKKQDVSSAASAAFDVLKQNLTKLIVRLKPGLVQGSGNPITDSPGGRRSGVSHHVVLGGMPENEPQVGAGRGMGDLSGMIMAGGARVVKPGDWVMIGGSKNNKTETDLMRQLGIVTKVEHSTSGVEVHVPKLGINLQLQQQFLNYLKEPPEPLRVTRSLATGLGIEDHPLLSPLSGRKRSHSDSVVGINPSASRLMANLPARIPSIVGRGVSKMKEVLRQIRKDMLALEENIPWDAVNNHWKVRRPLWRKGLKSIPADSHLDKIPGVAVATSAEKFATGSAADAVAAAPALVALMAGAMADLHEALRTDKEKGLFARGGAWEQRLCDLAEGGNNYIALRFLWEQMRESVQQWLAGQHVSEYGLRGSLEGLLPGSEGMTGGQFDLFMPVAGLQQQQQLGHVLPGSYPPGLPSTVMDKLAYLAVKRAVSCLEAAALKGEAYISQVPLEKILGPSQDSFALVRRMVERERELLGKQAAAAVQQHTAAPDDTRPLHLPVASEQKLPSSVAEGGVRNEGGSAVPSVQQPADVAAGAAAAVAGTNKVQSAVLKGDLNAPLADPETVVDTAPKTAAVAIAARPPPPQVETLLAAAPPPAESSTPAATSVAKNPHAHQHVLESLLSPEMKAELHATYQGIYNEPDSDLDDGPEATDMEDSD
ncbi:hypothetical protein CEUSTIGMA_g5782.t1 [Chlamydomonas eustigma]|uniref:Uncharacterized protein n=1 Tax=Chlamydomonas eustigma TaxID=1157962 RepID=A0A250X6E2_9CHLO|nr:hypothetical protein CEUSTIGMA_g5782.t1 [Chlamydomonas eustigma]|eukprot:GAX78340.1 hypothetical protein CEUSTIGMA_g5782.t1 [Chlamydomonas eustigma]